MLNCESRYSRGAYSQTRSHQQSIGYWNFDKVGTKFDMVRSHSAMTHVMVLSVKVRRNERLTKAVMADIGNMFGLTFGFKIHSNFNLRKKLPRNLQSFSFLSSYMGKVCTTLYFSKFGTKCLQWLVMDASTLNKLRKWTTKKFANLATTCFNVVGESKHFGSTNSKLFLHV
jgi:hypothetical protein